MTRTRLPRRWCVATLVSGVVLLVVAGCRNGHVEPPPFAPDEAAKKALEQYDTNRDGVLSGEELDQCPALKNSVESVGKDGRISADQIAARLRTFQEAKIGLLTVLVTVTLDGQPLPDATVTFVPEAFMGPNFKPATGVTDAYGKTVPRIEGQPAPGLPYGFYRVQVTCNGTALPTKYNTATVLGQEIGPEVPGPRGGIKLALSSR